MKVIALKKYSHGYSGFFEIEDRYVFFHFSNGRYKVLQQYVKSDFENYDHFVDVIRKFVRSTFFLNCPETISDLNREELDRVYAETQKT